MARWRQKLCWMVGGLLSWGVVLSTAHAQFPPPGGFGPPPGYTGAPEGPGPKESPFTMKDDGAPGAFTSMMDVRTNTHMPVMPGGVRRYFASWFPGVFTPAPRLALPAEFPNPSQTPDDAVSAWSVRQEGFGNGFTDLVDPYPPGPLGRLMGGTKLLYTELLEPPHRVPDRYTLSFKAEYLNWTVPKGPTSAVLLTTVNQNVLGSFGELGNTNTAILVGSGNNTVDYGSLTTWRYTMGIAIGYLPPIEVSGFNFSKNVTLFSGGSLTNPSQLLALPFQDVQPGFIIPGTGGIGIETVSIIAIPLTSPLGGLGGVVNISSQINFWGIEANGFIPLGESDCMRWDALIGYRHLNVNESLTMTTQVGGTVGSIFFNSTLLPQGFSNSTVDTFSTTNSLDAGQIGLRGTLNWNRFSLTSDMKFGVGMSEHNLNISGSSTLIQPVGGRATRTVSGGLLALGTNSGSYSVRVPAIASEVNIGLSYLLHSNIRLFGGFNLLYWSSIARPGDYINTVIDSRQVPLAGNYNPNLSSYNGPTAPSSIIRRDFTTQGIFLGVEIGF